MLQFLVLLGDLNSLYPLLFVEGGYVDTSDEFELASLLDGTCFNQNLAITLF